MILHYTALHSIFV